MDDAKLSDYIRRRAQLRGQRCQNIADLEATVRHVGLHAEAIDWEIDGLIAQFNQPARHLAGAALRAFWSELPSDQALGPAGLDWFEISPGGGRKRVNRPQARYLRRHIVEAYLPFQLSILERLGAFTEMRDVVRDALTKLAAVTARSPVVAPASRESVPACVARHRAALIGDAAATVRDAGEALDLVDAELDELMQQFNRLTRRPNVSIVCKWDVAPKAVGPLSGPAGPTFYMATAGLGGRRFVRMTSARGASENPVTTRELERARYHKAPDQIRSLANEITELRRRRRGYIDALKVVARAIKSLHRINPEDVK